MKYVNGMLGTVALGLVKVRRGAEGDWLFSLNGKGLEVGAVEEAKYTIFLYKGFISALVAAAILKDKLIFL